ncbi:MAG TPA: DsbA family protein [Hyphomicrobiaceae bacterium]|nr:DsbA family protein [Hyphomicrobiaceae bacterium]
MTKSNKSLEREPAVMPRRQILTIGASLATAGVLGTWYYTLRNPPPARTGAAPRRARGRLSMSELPKPGPLPEIVVGKEDAPVTIVEYADLTCPACANFHTNTLPTIKEKYIDTGKVRLFFREFPTNTPAIVAFMAVRCLPADKAPPLISALFARQEEWRGAASFDQLRDTLFSFGQQVGLTRAAFDTCVPVPKAGKVDLTPHQQKLAQDISSVRDRGHDGFGVSATPTFFINGKRLSGNSVEDFDRALAPLLNPS